MKNITVETMLKNLFAKQAKEIEVKINECMSLGNHYLYEATIYLDNHDNVIIKKTFEILSANIESNADLVSFETIKGMMNKHPIAHHIVPFDLYKTLINLEFASAGLGLTDVKNHLKEKTTNEFHYDIKLDHACFFADNIIAINELTSTMFD